MKMNRIIREKRKALGFTQEEVAECLGVSAPAVNKWESGKSYPDITMLPALARLLKTDANSLLSFEEELTKEKEAQFLNRASELLEKEGYKAAYNMLTEKMKEYPGSYGFICNGALLLEGGLFYSGEEEERERYLAEIEQLYRKVMESGDLEVKGQAANMLVSKHIQRKEYDEAQSLLDQFPDITFPKKRLEINLLKAKGEHEKAAREMEEQLLKEASDIYSRLLVMWEMAKEEKDEKRAEYLAGKCKKTAQLFDLSQYFVYAVDLELYALSKDKDKCMETLMLLLSSLEEDWQPGRSLLYSHIPVKEEGMYSLKRMKPGILRELKEDENFSFIKDDPEYGNL